MKKIIIPGFIIADTFFFLLLPVQAQSLQGGSETSECQTALQSAETRIEQGGTVAIEHITIDVSTLYEGYPNDRPSGYSFGLSGAGTESVMKSPQFLSAISKDIMTACSSVSLVEFGRSHSDWFLTFGYMGEGDVEPFTKCAPSRSSPSEKNPWGTVDCF